MRAVTHTILSDAPALALGMSKFVGPAGPLKEKDEMMVNGSKRHEVEAAKTTTPKPAAEEIKRKVYKDAGWKISRDGDVVRGENLRMVYECRIGEVYAPKSPRERGGGVEGGPKRLVDASFLGGRWRAVTEAVNDGDRDRVMDMDTFFVRYVDGTKNPARSDPRPRTTAGGDAARLARVEAKLDAILSALGVTVQVDD